MSMLYVVYHNQMYCPFGNVRWVTKWSPCIAGDRGGSDWNYFVLVQRKIWLIQFDVNLGPTKIALIHVLSYFEVGKLEVTLKNVKRTSVTHRAGTCERALTASHWKSNCRNLPAARTPVLHSLFQCRHYMDCKQQALRAICLVPLLQRNNSKGSKR